MRYKIEKIAVKILYGIGVFILKYLHFPNKIN